MKFFKCIKNYFTLAELFLWVGSVGLILTSFFVFKGQNVLSMIASLIGVTAILFIAKGNPFGQLLMIAFATIYGIISLEQKFYGEMLTYVGMTGPMAILSLISWLRHPYKGKRSQVEIHKITKIDLLILVALTLTVTVGFYFLLQALGTSNIIVSTLSVTTSFIAVFFTFRRSPFFSIAYSVNDIVLIVLWAIACFENIKYLSIVICFIAFLANDIYSFINWTKMYKKQKQNN